MGGKKQKPRREAPGPGQVWALVRRQHGVISRRQLLEIGYSRQAVEHRMSSARLHRVRQGVYAVGRAELSEQGNWMAAILCCGEDAVLSHRSAAALYGIGKEKIWERTARSTTPLIELSVPGSAGARRMDLQVHRRSLSARDLTTRDEIPVTSIVRTLLDYATLEPPNRVERAVNQADKHDHIDPEQLRRAIEAYSGVPGVRALRKVLDKDTFLLSDDELELLFHPLAREAGLPRPESKVKLQRLRGRLLLARSRPGGRDRRLALPPHARGPDP